jgi:hypothetical protein
MIVRHTNDIAIPGRNPECMGSAGLFRMPPFSSPAKSVAIVADLSGVRFDLM